MSRKRPHNQEGSENNVYLLPGCYATCSCSQTQQENNVYQNFFEHFSIVEVEEPSFAGDDVYVADGYGNIFYSHYVTYLCCEDIVRCTDAQKETDNLSDPEEEQGSKKTRFTISSCDDEDEDSDEIKREECPSYTVEEPPDDDEDHEPIPETSKTSK